MSHTIPQGFRMAGVACGIKKTAGKEDLTLIVSDFPATAAGVYTTNLVFAAPVAVDKAKTPKSGIRGVVINSGNANACTGSRGLGDAKSMCRWAGEAVDAKEEDFLVMSTGIIGEFLPMDKVAAGIKAARAALGCDLPALMSAARGILTTDNGPKVASRQLSIAGKPVQITAIAKGAAMIGPNMATMLGLVMTDAGLTPDDAQTVLRSAVSRSFNCISVEGHMSTNDTVLMLANGRSQPFSGDLLAEFQFALDDVCIELAKMIPNDGEGASHLIVIDVAGCRTAQDAHLIAKTVANSALVKTAVAGNDPNWGRIVSAAGYSGINFQPARVSLRVNGFQLYQQGSPLRFDAERVSNSIRDSRETLIELQFGEGNARSRFWTSDLTHEYVRMNADYHT